MAKQTTFNASFDFSASGAGFAQSALSEAHRLAELGQAVGTAPTLAQWNEAAKAFQAGALATGYKAPEKLWERTVKRAQEAGQLVDKPKATGEAATKKAEQRKAASDAVAQAATKSPAELIEAAKVAAAAGQFGEAAKLDKLAQAVTKAAERKAAEAVADAVKPLIEALNTSRDTMRKENDVNGLEMLAIIARAIVSTKDKRAQVAELCAALKPATPAKLAQLETKPARSRKGKAATVAA